MRPRSTVERLTLVRNCIPRPKGVDICTDVGDLANWYNIITALAWPNQLGTARGLTGFETARSRTTAFVDAMGHHICCVDTHVMVPHEYRAGRWDRPVAHRHDLRRRAEVGRARSDLNDAIRERNHGSLSARWKMIGRSGRPRPNGWKARICWDKASCLLQWTLVVLRLSTRSHD